MPPASTISTRAERPSGLVLSAAGLGTAATPPAQPDRGISDRFDLIALAGRGTFAEVWQVRDRRTGRPYALKQLRADYKDQKAARQILENEAEIGRKISSSHLAAVCEAQLDVELPYLVLEWLSGRTLEARLKRDKYLFCREALWIARQCAQGLHALLIAGFTHGDVKPSNIFLCDDGVVKVIDLGFARPDRHASTELDLSAAKTIAGTPDYMAPEALASGDHGGSSRDVYSLGVTLYRMLSGALPFQGSSVRDVLKQQQQSLPPRLRSIAPHVPREVDELVSRLLAKQPLRRGGGLSWLVHELIGLELSYLAAEAEIADEQGRVGGTSGPESQREENTGELRYGRVFESLRPERQAEENSGELSYDEAGEAVKSPLPKSGNLPELPRLTASDSST